MITAQQFVEDKLQRRTRNPHHMWWMKGATTRTRLGFVWYA